MSGAVAAMGGLPEQLDDPSQVWSEHSQARTAEADHRKVYKIASKAVLALVDNRCGALRREHGRVENAISAVPGPRIASAVVIISLLPSTWTIGTPGSMRNQIKKS
jgi:hypothetical protein